MNNRNNSKKFNSKFSGAFKKKSFSANSYKQQLDSNSFSNESRTPFDNNKRSSSNFRRNAESKANTSWDNVAGWYSEHLQGDTYHTRLVLPGVERIAKRLFSNPLEPISMLDIACGNGNLYNYIAKYHSINYLGIDLSARLIKEAKEEKRIGNSIEFIQADVSNLSSVTGSKTFNLVTCVLGLQNIENLEQAISEISKVTSKNSYFIFVITHPYFRIPKHSDWDMDQRRYLMYRKVWAYMSELKIEIDERPFKSQYENFVSEKTYTYHRPLSTYTKLLSKYNFKITDISEWCSDKKSEDNNPKARQENRARLEIPLFMCVVAQKG